MNWKDKYVRLSGENWVGSGCLISRLLRETTEENHGKITRDSAETRSRYILSATKNRYNWRYSCWYY